MGSKQVFAEGWSLVVQSLDTSSYGKDGAHSLTVCGATVHSVL